MAGFVRRHMSQRARRARALDRAVKNTLDALEPRVLLTTTYVVNSLLDTAANDGLTTLREAIQAANTDAAYFGVPAGSGADVITFAPVLFTGGPQTIVLTGTYKQLNVLADLTITGPGRDLLTIDAQATGNYSRIMYVGPGVTASASGVTLAKGRANYGYMLNGTYIGADGGAILNTGTLGLTDVRVSNNWAGGGGGGIFSTGAVSLENCEINGNSWSSTYSGTIHTSGSLTLNNSTIAGNTGTGIYTSATLSISNALITGNSGQGIYTTASLSVANTQISGNSGGGLRQTAGTLRVSTSTISANSSRGGIYTDSVDVVITGSTVSANVSTYMGGGLSLGGGGILLDCLISNNSCSSFGGGISSYGSLVVENTQITSNFAEDGHGGISSHGPLTVVDSIITSNTCSGFGGGIYAQDAMTVTDTEIADNRATDGGGIANTSDSATCRIERCQITGNRATEGGAGADLRSADTLITDSAFLNNSAGLSSLGSGGGLFVFTGGATLLRCTVSGNTAGYGGGISTWGQLKLQDCLISGNTAAYNYKGGGGLYLQGPASIINSTIAANVTSTTDGGAIYLDDHYTIVLVNTTLVDNLTGKASSPSIYCWYTDPVVLLKNSIVARNRNTVSNTQLDTNASSRVASTSSYNLIGANSGAPLTNGTNGNKVGTTTSPIDPLLDPLANYGGATQTHALRSGSPAINAGNSSQALGLDGLALQYDQRGPGYPRLMGSTVDMGAFEYRQGDASIGGVVWKDRDSDQARDAGEEGFAGINVSLYVDDNDGRFEGGGQDALVAIRATSSDGSYSVLGLPAGQYWADVDHAAAALTGYGLTTTSDPLVVQVANGQNLTTASFGFLRQIIVNTAQDVVNPTDGLLSLREAISDANNEPGVNMVFFAPSLSGATISLNVGLGQLSIGSDAAIQGPLGGITVSGGTTTRVFYIAPGVNASISRVNLELGSSFAGGSIYVANAATFQFSQGNIHDSSATQRGGAVYIESGATVTFRDVNFSNNAAVLAGGALFSDYASTVTLDRVAVDHNSSRLGGGIATSGTLALHNATIAINSAARYGGGIYTDTGTVSLVNTTVAQNVADSDRDGIGSAGGIYSFDEPVALVNTIVAQNVRNESTPDDIQGPLTPSSSYNIIGAGHPSIIAGILGNKCGTVLSPLDPGLMAFGNYGGLTQTLPLKVDSPALEAGDNAAAAAAGLTLDQRGLARVFDHDHDGTATVDIGAVEGLAPIVVNSLLDETTDTDSLLSLREAILAAGLQNGFDVIRFAPSLYAAGPITLPITRGELVIDSALELQGPLDGQITLDAAATSRVLRIAPTGFVIATNLTLLGGTADSGAGIRNEGTLTLSNVLLTGNAATQDGGGLWNSGVLTMLNSTVAGNSAGGNGGGVYHASGTLTGTNVTVAGNGANADDDASGTGGGIHVAGGSATLRNTIVATNTRGTATQTHDDAWGAFAASSYNLIGASDGSTGLSGTGARYGTANGPLDPRLTALDDHGGPVWTMGLLPASPVTDAGSNQAAADAGLTVDARGLPRIMDGLDSGIDRVDMGAFEQQYPLNQAPTFMEVQPLQGAVEGVPFTVSCEYLKSRSDAVDPENAALGFRIVSVLAGSLTLNGLPVVPGETCLLPGQNLVWTPPSITFGTDTTKTLDAFTVVAWDGQVESQTSAPVPIEVTSVGEKVNYAVLFSGGDKIDLNYQIYYANLKRTYDALVTHYGMKPYNIYVVYADGRNPAPDMKGNLNSDMSFAANVAPATHDNLRDTLTSLAAQIDANDHFFFWTYDHGLGAVNQPTVKGEEILKGWGTGQQINAEELRVWLQGLKVTDVPANYPGIPAGYGGIPAAYSTYVFGQCFSGGMLDNLTLDATHFGAAASNHYEASYADYFVSAYAAALEKGYNNTSQSFKYAFQHDSRAKSGPANAGTWTFNVEHPWSDGGNFAIFAMPADLNANPELGEIAPLELLSGDTLAITYDMLMAAAETTSPTGEAVRFWIEELDAGSLFRDGVELFVPLSINPPAMRTIGYGQSIDWHYSAGGSGTFGAFQLKVLDSAGTPVGDPQPLRVRLGETGSTLVAVNDNITLQHDQLNVLLNVLDNDQGAGREVLRVGVASHGDVTLDTATGQVRYSPHGGYIGTDTFSYLIADGVNTDIGTVCITVESFDPDAPVTFGSRFASTELGAPEGWVGLPADWNWDYRDQYIPDWTETFAIDISDSGVVAVRTARPDPGEGRIAYLGSTTASYRWHAGDTEPRWRWDWVTMEGTGEQKWVSDVNVEMLLLPVYDQNGDPMPMPSGIPNTPPGLQVYDAILATSVQVPEAMAASHYWDPANANEAPFRRSGGVWFDAGTEGSLWQEMTTGDYTFHYTVVDLADASANSSYYAVVNYDGGLYVGDHPQAQLWTVSRSGIAQVPSVNLRLTETGDSFASQITTAGHVIGYAEDDLNNYHAFLFNGTAVLDLGSLSGIEHSFAMAANASDTVVGYASDTLGDEHSGVAVVWTHAGAPVSLGSLPVDPGTPQWSIAYDINDNGLIVGASNGHAVLWSGGVIQDLNTIADGLPAGAVLTEARAINASGQVVATGTLSDGTHRAFFLDVVQALAATPDEIATGSQTVSNFNVLGNDTGAASVLGVDDSGLQGTLTWDGSGDMTYDPTGAFSSLAVGQTATTSFSYTVVNLQGATTIATVSITVTGQPALETFHVVSTTPTVSGVDVTLSELLNTTPLNLYSGISGAFGAADVSLTGEARGNIAGSLFWDAISNTLRFVSTGGPLAPDTYTLTLESRPNGIVSSTGHLLDGDADDADGGNYTTTFTVAPSNARVISLPDFARGPAQNILLPLHIDNAQGALGIELTISYDPTVLTITSISPAAGMPSGWTLTPNLQTPGEATLVLYGIAALPAGARDLVVLNATVPADADYTAAQRIAISDISINEGAIAVVGDTAVHKVLYFGDVSGNGAFSTTDAAYTARIAAKLDCGSDKSPLVDPVLVADVTGNGAVGALDAAYIAQYLAGLSVTAIPAPGPAPSTVAGLDPTVQIGNTDVPVLAGQTVVTPVRVIDDAYNLLGTTLYVDFDPTRLNLIESSIGLGAAVGTWSLTPNLSTPGHAVFVLYGTTQLPHGPAELLTLSFEALSASGPASLNISGQLDGANDTVLPMTAVPGQITVSAPGIFTGSNEANHYYVRRSGLNMEVRNGVTADATLLQSLPLASALHFEAGLGDDSLTLDYSGGDPFTDGGIVFHAGGGQDKVTVVGLAESFGVTNGQITHGAHSLAFDALETLDLSGGTYDLQSDLAGLSLVLAGQVATAVSQNLGSLTLEAGSRLELLSGLPVKVLRVNSLNVETTAVLDLGNSDLIIDYADGSSPLAAVEALLRAGYHGGDWQGTGITSSLAAANTGLYGVAVLDNAARPTPFEVFGGVDTSSHQQVLVKFTWVDDLDLDGFVTSNDAIVFANNYSDGASASHRLGDLNYNGHFDSNDAILFANAYNESLAQIDTILPSSESLLASTAILAPTDMNPVIEGTEPPIKSKTSRIGATSDNVWYKVQVRKGGAARVQRIRVVVKTGAWGIQGAVL